LQHDYFADEINALENGRCVSHNSKLLTLSPFLDDCRILRVKGRVQLSELDYESKHPIILPKCHGSLLLISFVHNHQNHAGVDSLITFLRKDFEVFGLRQMAKSVKKGCISCQRFDARACNEPPAPLPRERVTFVFSVTGLDFAGPVFCSDFPGKKFYSCSCSTFGIGRFID
jgi:hypothetical protein